MKCVGVCGCLLVKCSLCYLLVPLSTFLFQFDIRANNQHISMSVEERNTRSSKVLPLKKRRGVDDSTSCAQKSRRSLAVGSEASSIATTLEDSKEEGSSTDIIRIATPKSASPVYSNESTALALPPFFHYVDRSSEPDDDTLTPLVPMARVPTFPAKIYGKLKLIHST
jgi:hypothetical protein